MTLQELRAYYRLREYQISHLLNAKECYRHGKNFEQQTYSFLFYWADAMYEADQMRLTNLAEFIDVDAWKARGLK